MKKPNTLSVNIPEPCTQNWGDMTANSNGRHCSSCNKTVVDFSKLTDKELLEFLKKIKGEVCGRINSYQVNRPMLIPVKSNNLAWHKMLFGAAFVAGIVVKSDGQVIPQIVGQVHIPFQLPDNIVLPKDTSGGMPQNMIDQVNTITGGIPIKYGDVNGLVQINQPVDTRKYTISGKVGESNTGKLLESVDVYINGQLLTTTDKKGNYSCDVPDSLRNKPVTVMFYAWDHEEREITITVSGEYHLNAYLKYRKEEMIMGKMAIRRN